LSTAGSASEHAHDHDAIPPGTPALVVTISDGVAAGTREDDAGVALERALEAQGFAVERAAVPDERAQIEAALRAGVTHHAVLVTTGGTGLTPRDVTPQATLAVIDYEVPGLAEAIRAAGRARTPMADLSRGVVGVLGRTLIVNVPGSPRAALESISALEPTLRHALETLAGPFDHGLAGAGHAARPDLPDPDIHAT
jgi:molybdopterin adenylyltransferase